jgi:predicted permease
MITPKTLIRSLAVVGLLAFSWWMYPFWRMPDAALLWLFVVHGSAFVWALGAWIHHRIGFWLHASLSILIPAFFALVIVPLGFSGMDIGDSILTFAIWEAVPIAYVIFLCCERRELWK